MIKTLNYFLALPIMLLFSCSGHSVKEKINTVGDAAGQTAGEFFKGVGKGVDKVLEVKITSPASIADKGLQLGKSTVTSANEGTDNVLNVYAIFTKTFSGKLTAKVFDLKNNEIGRAAVEVTGKADDAQYVTFEFDKHTNIDSDFKITIE